MSHPVAVLPANVLGIAQRKGIEPTPESSILSVSDSLTDEARKLLQQKGIQVVEPRSVNALTGGKVIRSPANAAQMVAAAHPDAMAMYIEFETFEVNEYRRSEIVREDMPPTGYINMRTTVVLLDPTTRRVVWRSSGLDLAQINPAENIRRGRTALLEMLARLKPGR